MLHKTNFLLLGVCLFLLGQPLFAQQRPASPYPALNEKRNFLDAEDYFKNKADFVLAEQLFREVYNRLSPKQPMEKAYVGLRRAFTLNNLNKQNESLKLLDAIEKTIPANGKEGELLLADLYTYRAKAYAKNIVVDKALEWNDKAMVIKKKYYPELHPKMAESYAVYTYVHNYFTLDMGLTLDYLELEQQVVAKHPEEYPRYEQVALHYNMASFYSKQAEYLKASTNGKRAIQLLDPARQLHPAYMANCYALMATVHLRMEDADPAIKYIEEAMKYEVVNRKDSLARALAYTNLGYAYSLKWEMETATNYFKQAMGYYSERDTIYRAYGLDKLAEHYLNYPNVESNRPVLDSAYACMNAALRIYQSKYPEPNYNLAIPYGTLGFYYGVVDELEKSLHYFHAALLNSVPNFNNSDVFSQPLARDCIDGYLTELMLMNKSYASYALAKKNNDEKALLYSLSVNKLIDSLHDIKKRFFLDEYSIINHPNIQRNYGLILDILYYAHQKYPQQNHIQQFFNYMEQVKGNILLRNLSDIQQSKLYGVPDSLLVKSTHIAAGINDYLRIHPESIAGNYSEITNLNDTLFQLMRQKEGLEKHFRDHYPQYYQVRFQSPPPSIDQVKEKLKQHSLLEFYWTADAIFALYISKKEPQLFRIPVDATLTSAIDAHINFLKENSKEGFLNFQKTAYELYSILLAPIFKENIPSKLIIVTDGPLAAIPFETLLTSESHFKTINYRDLPYLLHKSAISYAYSTNTLLQAYDKSTLLDAPRLLAFSFSDEKGSENGADILSKYGLFPLAGAAAEVKSLGNLVPSDRFTSFYGPMAIKEHFFANYQNFDLIHLALHAQSDHHNRFNNRVFFHPPAEEDASESFICYAHELYALSPPPRLVVLGACNTGAGTHYTGEGTYSTARGFIYAGTPAVVMSLWPLSDQASKQINSTFYKAILTGASLEEALQQAKLDFIASSDEWTAHPSRWAALNVVGSTLPIVKPAMSFTYWAVGVGLLLLTLMVSYGYWRKKNGAVR
jgi:CHAT domain-containing protein